MICVKCSNRGYVSLISKTGQGDRVMRTFCVCEDGRKFRELTIEFRLEDLRALSYELLPELDEIRLLVSTEPVRAETRLKEMKNKLMAIITKVEEHGRKV